MKIIYIDAQNIHKSLEINHWRKLDWWKFLVYCKEKFHADKVKIFFWYMHRYKSLYKKLEDIWYEICFKETMILPNWDIKWNVDIDIAIIAIRDYYENNCNKFVLFTWDGDYNSLIYFWKEKWVFEKLIIPWSNNSSKLLFKASANQIIDIATMKSKLQKENPDIAI